MKILHLTIKKKLFDMILSGQQREYYREIKDYWMKRLIFNGRTIQTIEECHRQVIFGGFTPIALDAIMFKNGYSKNAPSILIECTGITHGKARPEWSDNWQGEVFIIKLGNIIEKNNLKTA